MNCLSNAATQLQFSLPKILGSYSQTNFYEPHKTIAADSLIMGAGKLGRSKLSLSKVSVNSVLVKSVDGLCRGGKLGRGS